MAIFIVRIELRNDPAGMDYDLLHAAMEAEGFSRTITGDNRTDYRLLPAEYYLAGPFDGSQVCGIAQRAAARTGKPFCVFVTVAVGMTWYNLDPV